jgi:protein AATF/BFR2
MKSRNTLKDLDPEALDGFQEFYHSDSGHDHSSANSSEDESKRADLAREHYAAVEKSKLRRDDLLSENPKYKGRVVSRKEVLSEDDLEQEAHNEDDYESDLVEYTDHDDEDNDEEGDDVNLKEEYESVIKKDKELMKTFSVRGKDDQRRGAQSRNLVKFGDSLLDLRIRFQKCLVYANSMPVSAVHSLYFGDEYQKTSEIKSEKEALRENCANLMKTLLDVQLNVIEQNSNVYAPEGVSEETLMKAVSQCRKRKAGDGFEYFQIASTLEDRIISPFKKSCIEKWNKRVQLSGSLGNKKFKAFNQELYAQIDQTISADSDRLFARTRTPRAEYKSFGKKFIQISEGEIFDDHDFYATLLKEFIERKTGDQEDYINIGVQWAKLKELQSKTKKKKEFARKATKGRKLKFDVHDKLANFMAPAEVETWEDYRIDELFSSLRRLHAN